MANDSEIDKSKSTIEGGKVQDNEFNGLFDQEPSFKLSWEDPGPTTQRFKISDLPREVRYSLKNISRSNLIYACFAIFLLVIGGWYGIQRKSNVARPALVVEDKVLAPLPSDLTETLCSSMIWKGELRKEFLGIQDLNVQLRVYDCLQFLKSPALRDKFAKKIEFAELNIYKKIVHVLYSEPGVSALEGDCSKFPKTKLCLADVLAYRAKGNRAKLKSELNKMSDSNGLAISLVELIKAEVALNDENWPQFKKSVMSSVQACPKYLTGLRSEILTWAQISLLKRGSYTEGANFGNINLKVLAGEDKNSTWKSRYLAQYSSPGSKDKLIQYAFSKAGVVQLVKSPELFSLIVPEAVRLKLATQILSRFDLVWDFQSLEGSSQRKSAEDVILWKARVLLSLKKNQEAEILLANWLQLSRSVSSEYWYVRGLANMKIDKWKQAQLYFNKAKRSGPIHWTLYWNLGFVAAKLGQSGLASEFANATIKDVVGPKMDRLAWMQLILAEEAFTRKDSAASVALTRRFLNTFPTDAAGWSLLSRGLKHMGKRTESVKAGMKLDELEAQLRYYLTDRYLFAPNGPFSGLR